MITPRRCWPVLLLGAGLLLGCAGQPPETLGVAAGRLAPCPTTPNCVSSQYDAELAPLPLALAPADAWPLIRAEVASMPRTRVVTVNDNYLHAEARSRIFGFVDDLELLLQADPGQLQLRSASRLGYSDLGVNRRRVDDLARRLIDAGVVVPAAASAAP